MSDRFIFAGAATVAALVFASGYVIGRKSHLRGQEGGIKPETVEVIRRDTIRREKPVFVRSVVKDFVVVPVRDTVRIRDTVWTVVPRTERVYEDSTYRAVVSGYDPRLECLDIYRTERTQVVTLTRTEAAPRLGFGLAVGPSVLVDVGGAPRFGVGITAGVRWSF